MFVIAQLTLSHPFSLPDTASHLANIVMHTTLCHASFLLNQDELTDSASSSGNASSHCFPSRTETEALNPHRTTTSGHSPRIALLPLSTAIKKLSQS
jgi:hypothetical protein